LPDGTVDTVVSTFTLCTIPGVVEAIRAGLVDALSRYRSSSAAAYVRGRDEVLVRVAPLFKLAPRWRGFLARVIREEDVKLLHAREHTGRPLSNDEFLATLEQKLGRTLKRQEPGPKPQLRRTPRRPNARAEAKPRN
jgi:putative transposase